MKLSGNSRAPCAGAPSGLLLAGWVFRVDCENSATGPSSSPHPTQESHIVGRQKEAHGFSRGSELRPGAPHKRGFGLCGSFDIHT